VTTTVQQILDAAAGWSSANAGAGPVAALTNREVLERVNSSQQGLFTKLAEQNRYFYVTGAVVSTTGGASGRQMDLSAQTPPVERILKILLPSGVELSQVDLQDLEAELAPRYYVQGEKLLEVNAEWGATGPVNLSLSYGYRAADLNLAAASLVANISIPDRFADYLAVDLALYLAHKDFGRAGSDPGEITRLEKKLTAIYADITAFIDHFGGPQARRFVQPTVQPGDKA
jgi:hypothetical protein